MADSDTEQSDNDTEKSEAWQLGEGAAEAMLGAVRRLRQSKDIGNLSLNVVVELLKAAYPNGLPHRAAEDG